MTACIGSRLLLKIAIAAAVLCRVSRLRHTLQLFVCAYVDSREPTSGMQAMCLIRSQLVVGAASDVTLASARILRSA